MADPNPPKQENPQAAFAMEQLRQKLRAEGAVLPGHVEVKPLPSESDLKDPKQNADLFVVRGNSPDNDPSHGPIVAIARRDPVNGALSIEANEGVIIDVQNDGVKAYYLKHPVSFTNAATGEKQDLLKFGAERTVSFAGTNRASVVSTWHYKSDQPLNLSVIPLNPLEQGAAQGSASIFIGPQTSNVKIDADSTISDMNNSPRIVIPSSMAQNATTSEQHINNVVQSEVALGSNTLTLGVNPFDKTLPRNTLADYALEIYNANDPKAFQLQHVSVSGDGMDALARTRAMMAAAAGTTGAEIRSSISIANTLHNAAAQER